MSQHDQVIANADGATVRADINSALGAIFTWSSGATAPSTTVAHMRWVDTTSGTVKRRNAANTGWIIESTIDETRVIDRSSNTILDESDHTKTFRATASFTQTLTAAATLGDGWAVGYRVEGGATLTIDPNSSENIDGATTKVIVGPASGFIACNGSAFYTVGFERITLATEQATTSGTSIDFTSIPAGVKRITMMFLGVSTSGTSVPIIQLGDSGGVEATGYTSLAADLVATPAITITSGTTGFALAGTHAAARVLHGAITLTLEDASDNTWIASGTLVNLAGSNVIVTCTGSKALSATLDRVRLTTVGGADTFDAGAVNISYEF